MTDIPLEAKVYCADGECGKSTAVIIDPLKQTVTDIVIALHGYDQRIVPLAHIVEADHETIRLGCTAEELAQMAPFTETHFVSGNPDMPIYPDGEWMTPYATAYPGETEYYEEELVPPGELALHRGDPVNATDGHVGDVGEFLIDPGSGHISHLVLLKGHLWGKREVTVGMGLIDRVEGGVVYLTVDKAAVEKLPAVKVKRHYPWEK